MMIPEPQDAFRLLGLAPEIRLQIYRQLDIPSYKVDIHWLEQYNVLYSNRVDCLTDLIDDSVLLRTCSLLRTEFKPILASHIIVRALVDWNDTNRLDSTLVRIQDRHAQLEGTFLEPSHIRTLVVYPWQYRKIIRHHLNEIRKDVSVFLPLATAWICATVKPMSALASLDVHLPAMETKEVGMMHIQIALKRMLDTVKRTLAAQDTPKLKRSSFAVRVHGVIDFPSSDDKFNLRYVTAEVQKDGDKMEVGVACQPCFRTKKWESFWWKSCDHVEPMKPMNR